MRYSTLDLRLVLLSLINRHATIAKREEILSAAVVSSTAVTDADAAPTPSRRSVTLLAVGVILIQLGLLAWGAVQHAPVWDEVGHLTAGISHWRSGRFDAYRVNPPLARLIATWPAVLAGAEVDWSLYSSKPWVRTESDLGDQFIRHYRSEVFFYVTICRWACLPLAAMGGWLCFIWSRQLNGDVGGIAAIVLWSFSPNVLAHAQLITPDTGAAAFGLLACYVFWRWLNKPSWLLSSGMGLTLGLALLTKFTLLVLGPLWLGLWTARLLRCRKEARRQALQLCSACVIAIYIIHFGYGFEETFRPLGDFEFVSQTFAGHLTDASSGLAAGNRFAGTWLGRVPVPVPANYLQGIDVQRRDFEQGLPSYLRGEWRMSGWWYYYIYAILVKEPIGTLCLLGMAALSVALRSPTIRVSGDLVPLVCGAGVLAFVSSQTGFNHHLRYVLPSLPLLYVFAARLLARGKSRWVLGLGVGCILASTASSLLMYPHSISYFNELAGGSKEGPRHLHNSNVDWGQDLLFLKKWCDQHPDSRPLYIVYSGGFDTAALDFWGEGVHHSHDPETRAALLENGGGPRWYAIFVGRLYDPPSNPDKLARFRGRKPDGRVADTIYLYYSSGSSKR